MRRHKSKPLIKKTCEQCNEFFGTRQPSRRFCDTNCRVLWHYHNSKGTNVEIEMIKKTNMWPRIVSTRRSMGFEICLNEDGTYLMRSM